MMVWWAPRRAAAPRPATHDMEAGPAARPGAEEATGLLKRASLSIAAARPGDGEEPARSDAVGAAVAATLWWGNTQLGALYNTRVVTYSKIYGSLGAVPLFLLGVFVNFHGSGYSSESGSKTEETQPVRHKET